MSPSLRKRSTSANGYREMVTINKSILIDEGETTLDYEQADRFLRALFQQHYDRHGYSVLHTSSVAVAACVLERCRHLEGLQQRNSSKQPSLLLQLFTTPDQESGYTPLHWALYTGNVPMSLLLLRVLQVLDTHEAIESHETSLLQLLQSTSSLTMRPMALLQDASTGTSSATLTGSPRKRSTSLGSYKGSSKSMLSSATTCLDRDQQTPADLLANLQRSELASCRRSLYRPVVVAPESSSASSSSPTKSRRPSFDTEGDEQDEFQVLSRGYQVLWQHDQQGSASSRTSPVTKRNHSYEVVSFGLAHHCALGVSSGDMASSASTTSRPQRIPAFKGQAVAVAAATHHTLVITRLGELFAFGLGKGGRLGLGHEEPCAVPTRVLGALKSQVVVAVAAAENHSLCVCRNGSVFAWGSNRFGQVQSGSTDSRTPQRIDDLKNSHCISVAAGERHSVALSKQGEVYVWGDNTAGQLGITHSRSSGQRAQRVDLGRKQAIAVSASSQSTAVLTAPVVGSLPVNTVYAWGHGNPVPIRVPLEPSKTIGASTISASSTTNRLINPVSIACALHHNVVLTSDGQVYTWGLHKDPLGNASNKSKANAAASQQVPLPSAAVAVAASENHTAVVTAEGSLYTWGSTYKGDILGHEGVRWQPNPKRVPGVQQAVAVAAAKEHTVLLLGISLPTVSPPVPSDSLEARSARTVCQSVVDIFNVLPCAVVAERTDNDMLRNYCTEFLRRNLDGVLTVCPKRMVHSYVMEYVESARMTDWAVLDGEMHPLLLKALFCNIDVSADDMPSIQVNVGLPEEGWIENVLQLATTDRAIALMKRYDATCDKSPVSARFRSNSRQYSEEPSAKSLALTSDLRFSSKEQAESRLSTLSKELRAVKKRLGQIAKLENKKDSLLPEEEEKITRKVQLEAELRLFQPALDRVRKCIEEFARRQQAEESKIHNEEIVTTDTSNPVHLEQKGKGEAVDVPIATPSFRCTACNVVCTDEKNYELHMNGRKHRNKLLQVAEQEKKQAAREILEQQQRHQLISYSGAIDSPVAKAKASPKKAPAWKNQNISPFNLPPPPHPVPDTIAKPATSFLEIISTEESNKRNITLSAAKKPTVQKVHPFVLSPGSVSQEKSLPWSLTPAIHTSDSTQGKPANPSLREIMNEEGMKKPQARIQIKTTGPSPATKTSVLPVPGSIPTVVSLPWATSPKVSICPKTQATSTSLGDFLKKPCSPKSHKMMLPGSTWATPGCSATPLSKAVVSPMRFEDIQEEERHLNEKADASWTAAQNDGNSHWFVERRERAGSFREIEEQAAIERENELMVHEQLEIERQIREAADKAKVERSKTKKAVKKHRPRNQKNKTKKLKGDQQQRNTTGKTKSRSS